MYAATAPAPEAAERLDDATDILLGETGRAPGDAGADTGCRSRGGSGGARPAELALERGGIRADSTGLVFLALDESGAMGVFKSCLSLEIDIVQNIELVIHVYLAHSGRPAWGGGEGGRGGRG